MTVDLRQMPIPADAPVMQLDCDPAPRQFRARFQGRDYSVLVTRDNVGHEVPAYRWHVSVAGATAVPPWNALAAIVHAVRPGIAFCIPMPPRSQWLNLNENVLHAWEVQGHELIAQWAFEGRGDQPT